MISHTTISFSNMTGPVEQVEFCGHPVLFIAPSGYGPPEVSPPKSMAVPCVMRIIEKECPPYHSSSSKSIRKSVRFSESLMASLSDI